MRRWLFVVFVICTMVFSCATATVKNIKENPEGYRGKSVIVRGTVVSVKRVGELNLIKLEQEGDGILCVKYGKKPEKGKKVTVSGYVRVMNIPLLKDFVFIVDKDSVKRFEEFKENRKDKFKEFVEMIKSEAQN